MKFKATLILFAIILMLNGCGLPALITRPIEFPAGQIKKPLTCGLIADESLYIPNEATFNGEVFYRKEPKFGYQQGFPNGEALSSVLTSTEYTLKGLYSNVLTLTPTGQENVDFYVLPRLSNVNITGSYTNSWSEHTCNVEIVQDFLDKNKIIIFDIRLTGNGTTTRNDLIGQDFYDATHEAISSFVKDIDKNDEYRFFIKNTDFFGKDEDSKLSALNDVLPQNTSDKVGNMLLLYSLRANNPKLFAGLLNRGVSPNVPREGLYPIHYAAIYNDPNAISLLLSAGANINQRDEYGHLPIYYSAWNNNDQATEKLLSANSDVDIADNTDANTKNRSGLIVEKFGDFCTSSSSKDRAKTCYKTAKTCFQSSNEQYKTVLEDVKWHDRWDFWIGLLRAAVRGAAQGALQGAIATQTNYQQREMNQISALSYASKTNTSYTAALDNRIAAQNASASQGSYSASSISASDSAGQIDTADNEHMIKSLENLITATESSVARVDGKLAELDK